MQRPAGICGRVVTHVQCTQTHSRIGSFHFVFCIARERGQLELTCAMETIAATFIALKWI